MFPSMTSRGTARIGGLAVHPTSNKASLDAFARIDARRQREKWQRRVAAQVPSVEFSLALLVFGLLALAMWYAWRVQW